jgi:hypothetical protein
MKLIFVQRADAGTARLTGLAVGGILPRVQLNLSSSACRHARSSLAARARFNRTRFCFNLIFSGTSCAAGAGMRRVCNPDDRLDTVETER